MEDDIDYDENENNNYEDDCQDNEIIEDNSITKKENDNGKSLDYEIIQNSEIIKNRDVIINNFIECSNLAYDEAELVLVNYNWNYDKLIEEWFDNMEKIKISSHIEQSPESEKKISDFFSNNNITQETCPVCYTEIEKDNSLSLKCNHQICNECYIEYIKNKLISDPTNILKTSCPLNGCNLYITRTIYKKCITELKFKKIFAKSLIRNFLITNKEIKTCPNPKCNLSIRVQNAIPKEIKCECGEIFCFSCLEESHIPCDCMIVEEWKKFTEEYGQDNYVWIKKETNAEKIFYIQNNFMKQCPKCRLLIEKNQGCNHMSCPCGYQFCWNCLVSWSNHRSCKKNLNVKVKPNEIPLISLSESKRKNFYIPGKSKTKNDKKEKLTLYERFMKYYKDWFKHYKDMEISEKIKEKILKLKYELIEEKNILENDLNFLDETANAIFDCNRALKYIIIFQYFLDDEEAEELININLDILENQIESLLELIELDQLPNIIKISDKNEFKKKFLEYKDHLINLIKPTEIFKKNLIDEIQNNLCDKLDFNRLKQLKKDYNIYKDKKKMK